MDDIRVVSVTDIISVGVHAYGGEPNEASVIGTAGNVFEDFVLAVNIRNDATTNARVKASRSPGLSQLPNFSTLTVYPPGSTASRHPTPNVRPRSSRDIASIASNERLPFDVGRWTDDQLKLILQQLSARGLMEKFVQSANEMSNEQSEQVLPTFRNKNDLFESPKNADNESPVPPTTSWSSLDET